jgi:uncharacterized membrane protein YjjP (DUF1212 family)
MVSRLDIPVPVPPSAENWGDPDTRGIVSFLLRIGRALHRYGTPAHRLEASLEELAERLGLHGQFFATPTSLFIALGEMNEQRTYLIRVEPGEVNLGKLSALDEIVERVAHLELDPVNAERQVRIVEAQPPHFGPVVNIIAQALSCAGAAIFFGGRWREACLAGVVGLILGVLWAFVAGNRRALRLFETLAGMISATIAVIGSWLWGGEVSASIVTVSGIIMLVPGLTMTVAINELATRNLASGTARLMGALTILTSLGFGAAIGLRLQTLFPLSLMPPELAITPLWIELPIVFISAMAFTVVFQARRRDAPWILLTSILALYGARLGGTFLGPELGACFGAFGVGLTSNLIARLRNRPAVITALPGLILLVPGSIGFRSFSALMDHNVIHGVEAAFTMFLVAISIVFGLFLASVALPTAKEL